MKKILSLVLAVVMVLGMVPAVFALEDDTVAESKYQEAIDFLSLDSVKLYHGGVAASEDVTRAQMALFTARFVTGQTDDAYWATTENDSGFTDLKGQPDYMLGAISFASQKGIVVGVGENKFAPNDNVTYRDALTMVVRALGYTLKASQYPWGYISKADELGLMEGIEGIAYTDTIARDVVAQILYNALFVELDGKTVLEAKFGIEGAFVMITATSKLTYNAKANKALAGCVEYAICDNTLEPTTTRCNQKLASFGFANLNEANAAVGQYFFVLYKGSFENVVEAVSLTDTYWNFGSKKAEIAQVNGSKKIKVSGKEYLVVSEYSKDGNYLGNIQNHSIEEVKLFTDAGSTTANVTNFAYYRGTDGNIYHVVNPNAPVYLYSAITNKYYKVATNNNTPNANVGLAAYTYEEIAGVPGTAPADATTALNSGDAGIINFVINNNTTETMGFSKWTPANFTALNYDKVSAYTKLLASDGNGDGVYDRVTVRNYKFGVITVTPGKTRVKKGTTSTNETATYVQINYSNATYMNTVSGAEFDSYDTAKVSGYLNSEQSLNPWADYITFTGLTLDEIKNGDGVIYYYNKFTHELEIVAVADKVSAYVRDFDCYNNTITLGDKVYSFGYNNLLASPLGTKEQSGTGTDVIANAATKNLNLLRGKYNHLVNAYVVDDKVVYVKDQDTEDNFVIVDSIVSMNENGIVVKAYSTLSDSLENIVISAIGGWSVGGYGGLDYYIYYLTTLGLTSLSNTVNMPVQTGVLYKVASYSAETGYNLDDITSTDLKATCQLLVNEWGYIIGTNGSNVFGEAKYTNTNDSDYWLILVPATATTSAKVYQFNGKMNTITFPDDTKIYKATNKDYVLVCTDGTFLQNAIAASSNITYVVYENLANVYNAYSAYGSYAQQQYSQYSTNVAFYNLFNGETVNVTLANSNPYAATTNTNLANAKTLVEGQIYKVVDGMLYADHTETINTVTYPAATPVAIETALAYYVQSGKFSAWTSTPLTYSATAADNDFYGQDDFAPTIAGLQQLANHYAYSNMWNGNTTMLKTMPKQNTNAGSIYFYSDDNTWTDRSNLWLGNATNYYYDAGVNARQGGSATAFFAMYPTAQVYLLYNKNTNKVNAYVVSTGHYAPAAPVTSDDTQTVARLNLTTANLNDIANNAIPATTYGDNFDTNPTASYVVYNNNVVVTVDYSADAINNIQATTTVIRAWNGTSVIDSSNSAENVYFQFNGDTLEITFVGVTSIDQLHVNINRDATDAGNNCWLEFYW